MMATESPKDLRLAIEERVGEGIEELDDVPLVLLRDVRRQRPDLAQGGCRWVLAADHVEVEHLGQGLFATVVEVRCTKRDVAGWAS